MKVRTIHDFYGIDEKCDHVAGEEFTVTDDRGKSLIAKGFVSEVEVKKAAKKVSK